MAPQRCAAAPLVLLLCFIAVLNANAAASVPAQPQQRPEAAKPQKAAAKAKAKPQADLGVGFSGGGFLLPFLLGALDGLRAAGAVDVATPAAGGSAGVFALAASAGIVPLPAVRAEALRLGADCRAEGMCYGVLDKRVRAAAARLLPADAAEQVTRRRGGAAISVSFLEGDAGSASSGSGRSGGGGGGGGSTFKTRQVLITEVASRDDLIDAVAASAYLPMWSGPNVTTIFRGRRAYDGAWGAGVDGFVPCPPAARRCLRVTSLPAGVSARSTIFEHTLFGPPAAQRSAAAAIGSVLGALTGNGGGAGSSSRPALSLASLLAALPSPEAAAELSAVSGPVMGRVSPGEGVAAVFPGRRCKLPVTVGEWSLFQTVPPDRHMSDVIYELGQKEALAWAADEGLLPPSKKGPAAAARSGGAVKKYDC